MYSLRGRESKERFIKEYETITPLLFTILLNGDTKKNACGGKLTDKYYHFSAINKKSKQEEIFFLGYDCGKQLLTMIDFPVDTIILFNPLKTYDCQNTTTLSQNNSLTHKSSFTKLAKQLFEMINLICLKYHIKNSKIFIDILHKIYKNPHQNPLPSDFKAINTYLYKLNTTIQDITTKLKENNPTMKNFDFEEARDYLKNYLAKKNDGVSIRF